MPTLVAEEYNDQVVNLYTGADYFYGLLTLNTGSQYDVNTSIVSVVSDEISPLVGGYGRLEFSYTSADINAYSAGVSVDSKRLTFTHDGSATGDWVFNKIAIIRVPSVKSSQSVKPVLSTFDQTNDVDLVNNRITVSSYSDFDNGDAVVLKSGAGVSLPAGISGTTKYYVKKISPDKIELYTDSLLTSIVDITGTSTGTAVIKNANGVLVGFHDLGGQFTVTALQSVVYDIAFNQGI